MITGGLCTADFAEAFQKWTVTDSIVSRFLMYMGCW